MEAESETGSETKQALGASAHDHSLKHSNARTPGSVDDDDEAQRKQSMQATLGDTMALSLPATPARTLCGQVPSTDIDVGVSRSTARETKVAGAGASAGGRVGVMGGDRSDKVGEGSAGLRRAGEGKIGEHGSRQNKEGVHGEGWQEVHTHSEVQGAEAGEARRLPDASEIENFHPRPQGQSNFSGASAAAASTSAPHPAAVPLGAFLSGLRGGGRGISGRGNIEQVSPVSSDKLVSTVSTSRELRPGDKGYWQV